MSGEEARNAQLSGEPVVLNGIVYARLERVIYEGGIAVTAELIDKNEHSSTITPIRFIKRIEEVTDDGTEANVLVADS